MCITRNPDSDRFTEVADAQKASDSSEEDQSEDDIFDRSRTKVSMIKDNEKNRTLQKGSRIKVELTDVQVSAGTLILSGKMV